jgi:hypothetical protein
LISLANGNFYGLLDSQCGYIGRSSNFNTFDVYWSSRLITFFM